MMRKTMLLKTNECIEMLDFKDELKFYYANIECDLIDIVRPYALQKQTRKCKDFILIVDDEGLLKADRKINVIGSIIYGYPLCGNILVAREEYTEDGIITIGLTKEDVEEFNEAFLKMLDYMEESI